MVNIMGWFGYGLYDGDGTQTCHIEFIEVAIPSLKNDDDMIFSFLKNKKTVIPDKYKKEFIKNSYNILKLKSLNNDVNNWDEDDCINWQMALSLFVDNCLVVPEKIHLYGLLASHFLKDKYCDDFDFPNKRKYTIKRFIEKVKNRSNIKILNKFNTLYKKNI